MTLSAPLLAAFFLLTALVYGAAGFGGGSTYTALLVLAGRGATEVPVVSLTCNIIVVSVGAWRFARAGHVDLKRIWPLFAASVPLAFDVARRDGRIKDGDLVMLEAMGGGFTWGASLIRI